jgi:hypothetical protein
MGDIKYDSRKVILKKNAASFEFIDWNSDLGEYVVEKKPTCLVEFFNEVLELEEGITFGEFMKFIFDDKYIDLYSDIFSSYLGRYELRNWMDEFEKSYTPNPDDKDKMTELQVFYSGTEISDNDWDGWIQDLPEFHGWGEYEPGEFSGFAVEFSAINTLKHFPLVLKNEFQIIKYENRERIVIADLKRALTVFNVLAAILYEISWSGSPSERDGHLEEIMGRLKSATEEIDKNGLNSERFIKSEDFFDGLKERINNWKKKNERA